MAPNQKVISLFFLILALLIGNSIFTYQNYRKLNSNNEWVVHTQQVLVAMNRVRNLASRAENPKVWQSPAAMKALAGDPIYFAQIQEAVQDLKKLTADNPSKQNKIKELESLLNVSREAKAAWWRGNNQDNFQVREILADMRQEENRLLGLRAEETDLSIHRTGFAFVLTFCTAVVFIFFTLFLWNKDLRSQINLNKSLGETRDKTRLLDSIMRSMSEGIVVADCNGQMTYFNDAAKRITGIGMSAQKPDKWTEEYGVFNEDKVTPCPEAEIPLVKAFHGVEVNHVIQFLRNSGHPMGIFVSVNGRPLRDELGNITGGLVVVRDITQEMQAEEGSKKLEAILRTQDFITSVLENLPNMVFVKDAKDLRFVMFNKAGEELLGIPRADLIGKNDYDFFPKEDADFFTAKDRKTLEARQLLDIPEETLQTREKGPRILHTKKIPVLNQDGIPQYLLGISEDITAQKAQENLKIYTKALETSNQELQDFVFVASHDLQEPLRKIQAFGEFLRDEFKAVLGETGRDYVERMRSAANRMQILINDLLALTRVTTKAKPFISVNLSDILQGVLSDLETRIQEKKAKVEVASLPTLEADETQMRQLFQNLIGNALKFQRPGVPPEITVYASAAPKAVDGEGRCRIKVEDNGIGFDNKYGELIFKVFERLHGRDEYEGTGIGLAVCRKVVERHGGTIKAEGIPGKGSIFTIELPLHHKS